MQNLFKSIFLLLSLALLPYCAFSQAEYQGNSNIQLLYGQDFDPGDINMATFSFEHAGSYKAFEHFGFVDFSQPTNDGSFKAYAEWFPKVSLSRAAGWDLNAGPLVDVLLGAGINAAFTEADEDFRALLVGPAFKFDIFGFYYFQLETFFYKQRDIGVNNYNGTYQITPSWDAPIPISDQLQFRFRGFADFIGKDGSASSQIVTQPQLLLDLGNLWDNPGKVFAGTEWRYWHNKYGVDGLTESVFQVELMIEL